MCVPLFYVHQYTGVQMIGKLLVMNWHVISIVIINYVRNQGNFKKLFNQQAIQPIHEQYNNTNDIGLVHIQQTQNCTLC